MNILHFHHWSFFQPAFKNAWIKFDKHFIILCYTRAVINVPSPTSYICFSSDISSLQLNLDVSLQDNLQKVSSILPSFGNFPKPIDDFPICMDISNMLLAYPHLNHLLNPI